VSRTDAIVGFVYEGVIRNLIIGLKYRNRRDNARQLVDMTIARLEALPQADVITWVPTTRRRARQRGGDQAEALARWLGKRTQVPVRGLLVKTSREAQTGRSRSERLDGPAIVARPLHHAQRVIVVDDVVTTGATFDRVRAALRAAGATEVVCVAIAATPAPVNTG
jgi:predicted amidophosphoribosyltransferase